MKVTYLGHSGFCIETSNAFCIFDFIRGELPEELYTSSKAVYVFVRHFHEDHYDPSVFALTEHVSNVRFIISKDTAKKAKRKKLDISAYDVCVVGPDERLEFDEHTVETYKSTDEGVAYLLSCADGVIYHAGDLNWWDWPGEDPEWNLQMEKDYKAEIAKLAGRSIDIAMLPLDPRQEESYYKGMDFFLDNVNVCDVYPMHFWDSPEVIERYVREYGAETSAKIHSDHLER